MSKVARCLVLLLLTSCGNGGDEKIDVVVVEAPRLDRWVGRSEAEMIRVWGEAKKSKLSGKNRIVTYALMNTQAHKAIADLPDEDLTQGPKVQGVDRDLVAFVGKAVANICFAEFTIDKKQKIAEVRLTRLSIGAACDPKTIKDTEHQPSAT